MQVLVHAGAGGVGQAACQLAALHGAKVTAVVGATHKVNAAKLAGAHHVLDRSAGPWSVEARRRVPDGFDVVLDPRGGPGLRDSYSQLRGTGRLIVYGAHNFLPRGKDRPNPLRLAWNFLTMPRFSPLEMIDHNASVQAFNLSYLFEHMERLNEAMTQLLGWANQSKIHPPPTQTFPLSQVAAAHEALQSGETVGKIVLIV
jgi:NADPH:quinone reductase-like Zn-dependent oxidoreductase